jgi:hypothetical protein
MEKKEKKRYTKPEILFETDLETKAGSPIGGGTGSADGIELFPGSNE